MAKLIASTNVSEFLASEDDVAARLSLGVDEQPLTLITNASDVVTGFGLTTIPNDWKNGQSTLKGLQIGSLVASIGSNAFYSCSGFAGALIIPSSITLIGSSAFRYCSGFTGDLIIPDSVTTIGAYAFSGCGAFASINILAINAPSLGSNVFLGSSATTIHVPVGATGYGATWGGLTVIYDL